VIRAAQLEAGGLRGRRPSPSGAGATSPCSPRSRGRRTQRASRVNPSSPRRSARKSRTIGTSHRRKAAPARRAAQAAEGACELQPRANCPRGPFSRPAEPVSCPSKKVYICSRSQSRRPRKINLLNQYRKIGDSVHFIDQICSQRQREDEQELAVLDSIIIAFHETQDIAYTPVQDVSIIKSSHRPTPSLLPMGSPSFETIIIIDYCSPRINMFFSHRYQEDRC
jgi:hypothetical protein